PNRPHSRTARWSGRANHRSRSIRAPAEERTSGLTGTGTTICSASPWAWSASTIPAIRAALPVRQAVHTTEVSYFTRSYSVLPVSAVGSTGIIVRTVLAWFAERLAVPVVRVD